MLYVLRTKQHRGSLAGRQAPPASGELSQTGTDRIGGAQSDRHRPHRGSSARQAPPASGELSQTGTARIGGAQPQTGTASTDGGVSQSVWHGPHRRTFSRRWAPPAQAGETRSLSSPRRRESGAQSAITAPPESDIKTAPTPRGLDLALLPQRDSSSMTAING